MIGAKALARAASGLRPIRWVMQIATPNNERSAEYRHGQNTGCGLRRRRMLWNAGRARVGVVVGAFVASSCFAATGLVVASVQEPVDPSRARPVSPDPWPERDRGDEQDDRTLRDLEDSADRRRSAPTVQPIQPGQTRAVGPGVESALIATFDPSIGVRRPLVPEGTFLANRRGRVAVARTGEHVFIFDRDAEGRSEPPMVIAPGTHLTALENMTGQLPASARYIVSGQVFVYSNVNYLVLSAPPLLELPPVSPPTASPTSPGLQPEAQDKTDDDRSAAVAPASPPSSPASSSPEAEALIAELESAVGPARRPLDSQIATPSATSAPDGVPPASRVISGGSQSLATGLATSERLLPEGALLASRRGRLVRSDQGQWVFAFDAGTSAGSAPAVRDRPLVVLPCLALQDMERNAHRLGDSVAMTVSGRVYLYAGRNYIMPTMFRIDRHGDDIASAH